MSFKVFADAVNKRFLQLEQTGQLFVVNLSKEEMWETYQSAYPKGTNEIFRERRHHECNTCYSFMKRLGRVVAIVDNKIETIWNIDGLPYPYDIVARELDKAISSKDISAAFFTDEKLAGKEFNIEENEAGDIQWDHFYADIDATFISSDAATKRSEIGSTVKVFKRALEEFSIETLDSVIDLCDSIYRGEEFLPQVTKFKKAKELYESGVKNKSLFIWVEYQNYPSKIRNSAIGTLIKDVQDGRDLEDAVKVFESVVAPSSYKRTTAVVTEGMKKEAIKTIDELGYRPSLLRRHATLQDISVNNALWANSDSQSHMKDELDDILDISTPTKAPQGSQDITIESFLSNVLPNATKIEALIENRHLSNFVSLVAPMETKAPNMFKWGNNFSWSYAGEMTDSMKERVKNAGGSTSGVLRFSIQWNESGREGECDLDAHCHTPNSHISYSSKSDGRGGVLDVDITRPSTQTKDGTAVENITFEDINLMSSGNYDFSVVRYARTSVTGFRAQIEFDGEIYEYNYDKPVGKTVNVARVTLKNGKFSIAHHMECSSSQKEQWDVTTKEYKEVSTIMLSPNHWDNNKIGNKHFFFMLKDCVNPDPVRGFYNEFLSEDLRKHRKVFEVLSSKMKCSPSKEQLSGLGFSSTQENSINLKVDGRPYNIKFKG